MLRENRRRRENGRSEAAATATTAGSVNENAAVTDGKANVLSNADDVVDQTSSAYPDNNTTAASPNNTSAAADRTAAATNVSPRTNPSQRRRQKDWILDVKQQQKSKYFLGTSELYR